MQGDYSGFWLSNWIDCEAVLLLEGEKAFGILAGTFLIDFFHGLL